MEDKQPPTDVSDDGGKREEKVTVDSLLVQHLIYEIRMLALMLLWYPQSKFVIVFSKLWDATAWYITIVNNSRKGNQSNQKAGEKRVHPTVTFEDPNSDVHDDIAAGVKKKRKKSGGNRPCQKQKADGNRGNTMDHAMPTRTSCTVEASVDLVTLPGKSQVQEPDKITMDHQKQLKLCPMYKQAKASLPGPLVFESRADVGLEHPHSTLQVLGLQSNAGATSSLNIVHQHAHSVYCNSHKFQDFPGCQDLPEYGYIDIMDDDSSGGSGLYSGMVAWPEPSDNTMSYYDTGADNMPFALNNGSTLLSSIEYESIANNYDL
ncbi:hypothetical protein ARMGADRAFT_1038767 [Armillaria gallica]|uniref:Uncharacterized protein n=1 Tax=Armillaria gallica TaxID=47427 RepID=A0A2H3CGU8_ARMGA|nr:hypothetical protein ARMGADRAFT_1038767 [Armillaria gallica]